MLVFVISTLAIATHGPTESPNAIPLKSIWAWEMPGTKDVRDLEPERKKYEKMVVVNRIEKSVAMNTFWRLGQNFKPKGNKNAGSAFVVDAEGLEALKEANAVLAKTKEAKVTFQAGTPLTLVFYAYGSSQFVRIGEVIKNENEIIVKYHFHIHGHRMSTKHYALVPLGDDLKGRIKVTIERTEDTVENYLADAKLPKLRDIDAKRLVCGSNVFRVLELPE